MARSKIGTVGLDTEAFEILSRQVKAQEEENRINQSTLTALKRRERIADDVLERYANLGEQIKLLPITTEELLSRLQIVEARIDTTIIELRSYASILRELAEHLSDRFDLFEIELSRRIGQLEDIQIARLISERINPSDADNWLVGLTRERKQRELRQHYFNLHEFREQAAKYGINTPIHLVNDIAHAEARIEELEADLAPKQS